jgi:hypothetical protein
MFMLDNPDRQLAAMVNIKDLFSIIKGEFQDKFNENIEKLLAYGQNYQSKGSVSIENNPFEDKGSST